MGHSLSALISRRHALEDVRAVLPTAVLCPLAQAWVLLPITDALDEAVPDIAALAARLSAHAPVVRVATDYFGGRGAQDATVWVDGQVVLQLADTIEDPASWPDSPISRALRHVGVVAASGQDEFDALGLGRHRHTEDWHE